MQLVTDVDLLLPLWEDLERRKDTDMQPAVLVVAELLQRSPSVGSTLTSRQIPFDIAGTDEIMSGGLPDLRRVAAVVTPTESTLRPHRAAHALVHRAAKVGIPTYTLQHGFENVGLTYFDEFQTSTMVEFASRTIFIWGSLDTLHPEARAETRARCVPVGCPKSNERPAHVQKPGGRSRLVVIFENIHWLRYNDAYRSEFLSDLQRTARAFPDVTFVVKPHPGGKWLTSRYMGDLPQIENVLIANPDDPEWARYTGADLIAMADAVITTPSTVAVDCARLGCPVAVIAYELDLSKYDPLPLIQTGSDWEEFLKGLEHRSNRANLKQKASEFLNANLIPGDAAGRIISRIAADIRRTLPSRADREPELSSTERPE